MPKKTGKSHYAAGVSLAGLVLDEEEGAEVYSAAYDQGQAKVVWDLATDMIERDALTADPLGLSGLLEVVKYRSTINAPAILGEYSPVSREVRSKHGWNPSVAVYDEFHAVPNREMYDTLKDSMGARLEPLLFIITNAGVDRASICYELREYALAVNAGRVVDPTFLGVIYGAEPDDDWTDPAVWERVHPGIPVTVPVDRVAQACEQAKAQPSAVNSFKRWYLSLWTQQVTKWLDSDMWDAACDDVDWDAYAGRRCFGGLDLGAVSDLTAWALAFPAPEDAETVTLLCRAWCPEARLTDPSNPYRDVYQGWANDGWLLTTPGRVTDYGMVREQILEDADTYGLVDMAMDRKFQGNQLAMELATDHGLTVAGMGTGMVSMTSPCDEFERRLLIEPAKVRHDGNPVLSWAVGNVALKLGNDGKSKMPVKDAEQAKIDPVVAALMALDRAMRHEGEDAGSAYESKELLVL